MFELIYFEMPTPAPNEDIRPLLIYDGDCSICRRFASWLTARDVNHRLQLRPYQSLDLSPSQVVLARRSVQWVNGKGPWLQRGRAVLEALALAGYPWVRWLRWPPVIQVIDLGYCWVAGNRQVVGRWFNR